MFPIKQSPHQVEPIGPFKQKIQQPNQCDLGLKARSEDLDENGHRARMKEEEQGNVEPIQFEEVVRVHLRKNTPLFFINVDSDFDH
jgi:hypothetical protein